MVERLKEGYESDIPEERFGEESDEYEPDDAAGNDSDDDFRSSCRTENLKAIQTRLSTRNKSKHGDSDSIPDEVVEPKKRASVDENGDSITISDDDDGKIDFLFYLDFFRFLFFYGISVRKPSSFMPNTSFFKQDDRYKPIRKMYGKNEYVYIMDAKKSGNVGRYFNHSCCPNLFVQNVFVDTHDLRFPWVAFFSLDNIRAGSELTWNYNYDVGSVPGKVLYCECGAVNCRGRLL